MYKGSMVGGYTIIETLIFLAISSLLFLSAVSTIGGRQASVQFTQATRDAQSKIQELINQVSTGYYPSAGYTCTASVAGLSFTNISSVQGTSKDCVFLGKVLKLGANIAVLGKDAAGDYSVINVAARRLNDATKKEVISLAEATPTAIRASTSTQRFQYGLAVTRIIDPVSGNRFGSIALFSSLPKNQGSTGTLASGTLRVGYAGVPGSNLTDTVADAETKASGVTDAVMNPINGLVICMADNAVVSDATRKAMITVGEGRGQAVVKLDTGNYNSALCEG